MELIGWDVFYGSSTPELDPFSVRFAASFEARTPTLHVSKTTGLVPGEKVVVVGSGFDPAASTGVRPPLPGQPSGAYVIFGRFADDWRPSTGAPSSARQVINQKWALPGSSLDVLDPTGTNADFVKIDAKGNFATELTIGELDGPGTYGFYTYAGSGAVNADQEVAVLASVDAAA